MSKNALAQLLRHLTGQHSVELDFTGPGELDQPVKTGSNLPAPVPGPRDMLRAMQARHPSMDAARLRAMRPEDEEDDEPSKHPMERMQLHEYLRSLEGPDRAI